jgi:SulP family sulfate permease
MLPDQRRPTTADAIAGLSVAFVAIPQSLAYAEIAGMPAYTGLYATAFPALLAAFFAHSRYLQTGPVAMTALLAFGALTPLAVEKTPEYIGLAALLALLVGIFRLLLGVLRLGRIADYMSQPVIVGFTTAAAILIAGSQSDKAFGVEGAPSGLFEKLLHVLTNPGEWTFAAILVSLATAAIVIGGRRIHVLFPGVLVAAVAGILLGAFGDYPAALVGEVPSGLPSLTLDLDWAAIPSLLVAGIVIAAVGFAEPTAISRTLAAQDRERWDANRELVSQGISNITAGLSGAFPVGGSFSRSSVNKLAGAQTRWAGAITGATVIAFLPFAGVLSSLPQAVLGSIVIVAVAKLIRINDMVRIARSSIPQAIVAWGTAIATLLLAPRVDHAILAGVGLSLLVHVFREAGRVTVDASFSDGTLTLSPSGVMFFASATRFQEVLLDNLAEHPETDALVIDLSRLGRLDYTGVGVLEAVRDEAEAADTTFSVTNIPVHAHAYLSRFE